MSHPSLLFPHGHFETTPDNDFTDDPVHTFLPYLPVLEAQDTRNSAPASRSLATWPSQMQTQVMSPKKVRQENFRGWWRDAHQRSGPQYARLLENHEHENTGQFGVHTVFESFVLHVSILFLRHKRKKARNRETVARQREREEREGFLISVAKSMSMKSRRNSI